jgi:hypothetical protein
MVALGAWAVMAVPVAMVGRGWSALTVRRRAPRAAVAVRVVLVVLVVLVAQAVMVVR